MIDQDDGILANFFSFVIDLSRFINMAQHVTIATKTTATIIIIIAMTNAMTRLNTMCYHLDQAYLFELSYGF